MKKVEIIFKSIYCDMCSYEISVITKSIVGVENFSIHRRTNTLIINFENKISISIKELKENFEKEGYPVLTIGLKNSNYATTPF